MKQTERKKLATLAALFALCAVLLPALAGAYPAEAPRTGQTKCYADNGTEKACVGTGQDGDWLAGVPWPVPRFTDHGDNTTTDNLTGLMWANNANLLGTFDADNDTDDTSNDGRVTWQHALDYIKKLNRESYFGHSDWRLPNLNELESLVHAGVYNPAFPPVHPFLNVQSNRYWSSTSSVMNTDAAWYVNFSSGLVGADFKSNFYYYVWPVRSGQCGALENSVVCLPRTGQIACYDSDGAGIDCADTGQDGDKLAGVPLAVTRFTASADAVTDNLTGLMWAKNANLPNGNVTWQEALNYVAGMNAGTNPNFGYTDWRLPNKRELRSLADYAHTSPALPAANPFLNAYYSYWSSTSCAVSTGEAWVVDMYYGGSAYSIIKTGYHYVWPVRGPVADMVIIKSGTGAGMVTSADGKIDCGSDCSESYTIGTEVTLTAAADAGSAFAGWSGGGCLGTDNCTLSVNDNLTVTANFDLVPTTTTTSVAPTTTTQPTTTTTIGDTTTTTTTQPTTTTTVSGRPCPAKKTLGEDNPNLENLRAFRDGRLAQSAVGRKITKIYYNNADNINAAFDKSPALRAAARRVLEAIAPLLGR